MSDNEREELAAIIEREYVRAIDRKRPSDAFTAPAHAIIAAGYTKEQYIPDHHQETAE